MVNFYAETPVDLYNGTRWKDFRFYRETLSPILPLVLGGNASFYEDSTFSHIFSRIFTLNIYQFPSLTSSLKFPHLSNCRTCTTCSRISSVEFLELLRVR